MVLKIRRHDVGRDRWHVTVKPTGWAEANAFKGWMSEHMPDCMCAYRFNDGIESHYEVRGSDHQQLVLLMMVWSA